MKKSALSVTAGATALALVIAGAVGARSQATQIKLTTALNAAQEVPKPTGAVGAARGTFTATLTQSATGAVLAWRLTFSGLTGPATAAHVHIAPRGQAGPVAVPLCGPCTTGATGKETVDATVVNAVKAGRAYVNVHTSANPAGEIRGQVAVRAATRTVLNARQEVPKPKGNVTRARGVFTATVTKTGSSALVRWRLTFSRLTGRATAAHIHIGARGKAGRVAVPLCAPCRSGMRGKKTVGAAVLKALQAGNAYVNVHTPRNRAGEIRGQLPKVALSITAGSPSGGDSGGGGDDPYYP